jgi:selenide, water dikinase
MADTSRRRAVMARSRKLGHCICNPKDPCPCPTLLEHNICPCAGERMPVKTGDVALTRHVRKAGCASKVGQADLLRILGKLPPVTHPDVLVGTAAGDDAGVFRLDEKHALVQTVDVFTPCVDDAYLFGQIAAANSVSDVYAMGARPLSALSIIGFPIDSLDGSIMEDLLRGGIDKLNEADCPVIGGHSINDEEIKCGFAITGLIETAKTIIRDNAQPGDVLVLTKPLGTGMIAFAAQLGLIEAACLEETGRWMAELNRDAAELMVTHNANACTDVTGYGLAGHLVAMARGAQVNAEIDLSALPVFAMVPECIEKEVFGGAVDRNQAYTMGQIHLSDEKAGTGLLSIFFDPQTSGGLLIALPEYEAAAFIAAMHERGHNATSRIGRILERPADASDSRVTVINPAFGNLTGTRHVLDLSRAKAPVTPEPEAVPVSFADIACCDEPPDLGKLEAHTAEPDTPAIPEAPEKEPDMDALTQFSAFMKEANKPGRIDQRNKKLMAIALSIAHHCHPCLKIHLQSAVKMGIPMEDIDEAATLAVAFGGCTAMMFYKETRQELEL